MIGLPFAFAAPWVLVGLIALPALWWLLRVTPPKPREVTFPPLRLLQRIRREDQTPSRTPWWLTALRLLLAALVIFALAGPTFRPGADTLSGSGPVLLVVDDGWSAAPDWEARVATAETVLDTAARDGRPVMLVLPGEGAAQPLAAATAENAAARLAVARPRAYPPDRDAIADALAASAADTPPGDVVWIAEPVDADAGAAFAGRLAALAPGAALHLAGADSAAPPMLVAVDHAGEALTATVRAVDGGTLQPATLRALDRRGLLLDEVPLAPDAGAAEATVRFEMPIELRNEAARIEIAGVASAAAVQLLDERWRRRTVGLFSGVDADRAQPLLSPTYYLDRALAPFADVRQPRSSDMPDAIAGYVEAGISAIVMADVGNLAGPAAAALEGFVDGGGMLIRFAGPRLAAGEDELVPVPLRSGGRTLGGSLSWEEPQPLAAFPEGSPFEGLAVPADVAVERQVLAEPDPDLSARTWASLSDGTPLVTAARRGDGWIVLFHVTADTSWSNLPISGTFVEMLRRTVALAEAGTAGADGGSAGETLLAPLSILDGTGRPVTPPSEVRGIPASAVDTAVPSRETPPGLYGADDAFRTVNLLGPESRFPRLDTSGFAGADVVPLAGASGIDLVPWLFAIAFALLLVDALAVLALFGALGARRAAAAAAVAFAVLAGLPDAARAQALSAEDEALIFAVSQTRLAYVLTGNDEIDRTSELGLQTLTDVLAARTALEGGSPIAVDPAVDELSLFPLLYWPLDPDSIVPTPEAMARVDAYMRNGGTVLFDTRDDLAAAPGDGSVTPTTLRLREILASLDVPPLEPVPADHVLTKAFYLLNEFPGRTIGSPLWIAADEPPSPDEDPTRPVRAGDGVSPILITGNDFAGAWASDASGRFLQPLVPGEPRQREYAFRAGVNIVMYALTGNYKADQVHIPALLERLGQ
jgi:hypothetical protein